MAFGSHSLYENALSSESQNCFFNFTMARMYEKSDVFPKKTTADVIKLDEYPKFGGMIDRRTVYYFCLYMEDGKIYYQKRNLKHTVINTFKQHGKEAKTFNQFKPNAIDWSKILNRYKRVPVESNRTNADVRTGFKIGSDYLVKAHFTFGQRIVQRDTAHVIQTLNVPLLFYLRPSRNRHLSEERVDDAYFPYRTLCYYDRRILEPHTCYRIPPGTVYVLFSTQKNFFRVSVVEAILNLKMAYVDPVRVRVTKMEGMYDVPVKTPYIEDEPEEEYEEILEADETMESTAATMESTSFETMESTSYETMESTAHVTLNGNVETVNAQSFMNLDSGIVQYFNLNSETEAIVNSDIQNIEPENNGSLLELLTPPTYLVIQNHPVERNVVVASQDFVRGFQIMKRQQYGNPKESIVISNEPGELLNLSVEPEMTELGFMDHLETNPVKEAELDRLMDDLCSPLV